MPFGNNLIQELDPTHGCVLMFSGGRDSTLAALRLHDQGYRVTLVTVSSGHLFGIAAVRHRLREMRAALPSDTQWIRVGQPDELRTDTSFYEMTCLPCHHAYVVVAVSVAVHLKAKTLAFGYAGYQNTWPEQTPLAVNRLHRTLEQQGIRLSLPVYDLFSREEVETALSDYGVSQASLEQKCLQQVRNVALSDDRLNTQVNLWERAIADSLSKLDLIKVRILEMATIDDV